MRCSLNYEYIKLIGIRRPTHNHVGIVDFGHTRRARGLNCQICQHGNPFKVTAQMSNFDLSLPQPLLKKNTNSSLLQNQVSHLKNVEKYSEK